MSTVDKDDVFGISSVETVVESGGSSSVTSTRSSSLTTKPTDRAPTLAVPQSLRMVGQKTRRLSLAPPPLDDPAAEMDAEIKRSRETHDCNLSALKLTRAPSNLPLKALTKLSLSDNALVSLPEAMFSDDNCINLIQLDMNSNQLESLPTSLFFLPSLQDLMMNHNKLINLPDGVSGPSLPAGSKPFLPSLERVGIEFSNLKEFPLCFFTHCAALTEVLLGQNERMLDMEILLTGLQSCPVSKNWQTGARTEKVVLKLDNRPRLMRNMQRDVWTEALPWLSVSLHKIYPDCVLDFLYLGSMRTAQTVTVYHDLDIGYVLTIGRDLDVLIEPGMQHKVLLIDDYPGAIISAVYSEAFAFIDEARAAKKGILIHCFAGLSRSVTIAAAYVMRTNHLTCDQALALIREARPAAQPNEGFMKSLKADEAKLISGAY